MHSPDDGPAPGHRSPLVLWLSVAQLVSWGCVFYGFSLLMEPVEAALGMSRAESSLAFSLALLMEGLLAYPVGRWIDRGHERAVMAGGSLLMGLALAAHSAVQTPLQFYAVWLMLGVGMSATLYPPAFAVVGVSVMVGRVRTLPPTVTVPACPLAVSATVPPYVVTLSMRGSSAIRLTPKIG